MKNLFVTRSSVKIMPSDPKTIHFYKKVGSLIVLRIEELRESEVADGEKKAAGWL